MNSSGGIDYPTLMIFCLVWGMGGSFISLLLSRFMAKKMMGVELIDPKRPSDEEARWLVEKVHDLSRLAQLPKMPEVGIYPGQEVNAFATGPSKARSLVAVSEGLLRSMNRDEVEGVLAHEVAHIQNGDMVTMTLIQGVVNAFAMFLSRVVAFFIASALSSSKDGERSSSSPFIEGIIRFVLEIAFTLLGSLLVCYFSRQREFRADAGSAKLSGTREKMTGALKALQRLYGRSDNDEEEEDSSLSPSPISALKISGKGGKGKSWLALFATHPPLEDRLAALSR